MHRNLKRMIFAVLAFVFVLSCFSVMVFAAERGKIESFSIDPLNKGEEYFIDWEKQSSDGGYYFYLPAGSDLSSVTVRFSANGDVCVGEKKLVSGEATDAFAGKTSAVLTCANATYKVHFLSSKNVPSVFIKTESGSLDAIHADKSHKEKGTIAIVDDDEVVVDAALSYIKGRGNITWLYSKKPYNIKFEKKTDLFGMGKAKKWSLIASYYDTSLLRNSFAYNLADNVGLKYTASSKHVDLYINGEYQGNYLLCECVEPGSSRVDITDLEKLNEEANPDLDLKSLSVLGNINGTAADSIKYVQIPNDPQDISGGYLLELEFASEANNRYAKEVSGFVTKRGQAVVIKSPEYASKAEVEYISSFWQEFESAVYSENGINSLGKHYTDYVDLDSLVKMYIIEELTMDVDAGLSSCFFCKDSGSDKLVASPVWDFDSSLGSWEEIRNGVSPFDTSKWFVGIMSIAADSNPSGNELNTIFAALCRHGDFVAEAKKIWKESFLPNLGENSASYIRSLASEIRSSAIMDMQRWPREQDWQNKAAIGSFDDSVLALVAFLEKRTASLSKGLGAQGAMLYYDANGGSGIMFNENIASVGENLTVKKNCFTPSSSELSFAGWNTAKDGSGTDYTPGDNLALKDEITVLYAQWKEGEDGEKTNAFVAFFNRIAQFFRDLFEKIKNLFS